MKELFLFSSGIDWTSSIISMSSWYPSKVNTNSIRSLYHVGVKYNLTVFQLTVAMVVLRPNSNCNPSSVSLINVPVCDLFTDSWINVAIVLICCLKYGWSRL